MALPFAADACLVASSFEADADDADDAAELADDAAAALEEAALSAEVFAFVSEVFAAEADLAAAVACSVALPAFVVAVEADDAALSADFPAAVALAEACPALVDAALADNAAAVFEPAAAEALCPAAVSEDLAFVSDVFAAFANFLPPLPRKLHYWHLMMHSFLKISLPLLRPPHPVPRWQLLTPSWSLWMQKWLPIFVMLRHSFLTFSRHWRW